MVHHHHSLVGSIKLLLLLHLYLLLQEVLNFYQNINKNKKKINFLKFNQKLPFGGLGFPTTVTFAVESALPLLFFNKIVYCPESSWTAFSILKN